MFTCIYFKNDLILLKYLFTFKNTYIIQRVARHSTNLIDEKFDHSKQNHRDLFPKHQLVIARKSFEYTYVLSPLN